MSTACTACAVLDADVIILQFHCGISLKAFLVAILVVRGWVHLQYFTANSSSSQFPPILWVPHQRCHAVRHRDAAAYGRGVLAQRVGHRTVSIHWDVKPCLINQSINQGVGLSIKLSWVRFPAGP